MLFRSNMGQDGTASDGTLDEASVVIGDVSIQVIGPAVVTDYLVGGGMCNACLLYTSTGFLLSKAQELHYKYSCLNFCFYAKISLGQSFSQAVLKTRK